MRSRTFWDQSPLLASTGLIAKSSKWAQRPVENPISWGIGTLSGIQTLLTGAILTKNCFDLTQASANLILYLFPRKPPSEPPHFNIVVTGSSGTLSKSHNG